VKKYYAVIALIPVLAVVLACGGAAIPCISWTVVQAPLPLTITQGAGGEVTLSGIAAPDDFTLDSFTASQGISVTKTGSRKFTISSASTVVAGTYKVTLTLSPTAQTFCAKQNVDVSVVVIPGS
jgi:hypothetical protein